MIKVEIKQETDTRWIAEVPVIPGALAMQAMVLLVLWRNCSPLGLA
jgi:hypothetical protein